MFTITGSLKWLWSITLGQLPYFKRRTTAETPTVVEKGFEESVFKTVFGYPEPITSLEEQDAIHTRIMQNLDYVAAYNPEVPLQALLHINLRYFTVITATRGLVSGQAALIRCNIPLASGEDFQATFEKIVHTATVILKTIERTKKDFDDCEPVRLSVDAYPFWVKALTDFERMKATLLEVQHFALWVIQERYPTSELYLPNINASVAERKAIIHEPANTI